jgi:hypothetical protein
LLVAKNFGAVLLRSKPVLDLSKAYAKRALFAIAPDAALRALSIRSRRIIERQCRDLGLDAMARRVASSSEGRVQAGPFAGMFLDYELLPVHGAPKYLGTYELELHGLVERAIALNPPTVLNIGCAEGYYAVGFATRLPQARIYFADADPKAERATLGNAGFNAVTHQMTAIGIIHAGEFQHYLQPNSLVVMDCEGAEFDLLNPRADPILIDSTILVEVHPEGGNADEIAFRFADTHEIIRIEPTLRSTPEANERTGHKTWLFMTRRR